MIGKGPKFPVDFFKILAILRVINKEGFGSRWDVFLGCISIVLFFSSNFRLL